MARPPARKPWFHEASGFYCVTLNGKREYLDRDYKVACRRLKELRFAAARGIDLTQRDWAEAPLSDLADEFLDDIKARRAAGTYRNCRERLLRAMRIIGSNLRVADVRRHHLSKIEQKMVGAYRPATIRDTLAVVQQLFNFAVRNDIVDFSPLAGYQKPSGGGRSRVITDDEFQSLLRNADICFRRLLIALRLTGCRPGEARKLTWEMVDLENGIWVIPQHKTISMQRDPTPRIIPLPDPVLKLCHFLHRNRPLGTDHVFLNMWKQPYTKDCVVRKMDRLRKKAGIATKAGENIVLYTARHTYATDAVGRVSDMELATLMGHTTTRMLSRYVHLNSDRLREIQRRAQGSG